MRRRTTDFDTITVFTPMTPFRRHLRRYKIDAHNLEKKTPQRRKSVRKGKYGGEGGILPQVHTENPRIMVKPNPCVRNGLKTPI